METVTDVARSNSSEKIQFFTNDTGEFLTYYTFLYLIMKKGSEGIFKSTKTNLSCANSVVIPFV